MSNNNNKYFTKKHSKTVFLVLSAIILAGVIYIASPYINTIVFAIIVSYILQPIYKFLTKKVKTKKISASILSTAITIIFTLVIGIITVIAVINLASLVLEQVNNLQVENTTLSDYLKDIITWINNQADLLNIPAELTLQEVISNIRSFISSIANNILSAASSITSFSVDAILNLTIFYGLIYTIVPNFDKYLNFIKKVSPFEKEITSLYLDRTLKTAKSMAWGILIVALGQSLSSTLLFIVLGTPYIFLLTIIMAITSIIPILASGMVTFPIAAIYILSGQIVKGIIVIIYQLVVVSNVDGILRAKMIPKDVQMPIFISFISIFGGLAIWGIWGLIYGPLGFILLLTTIEVFRDYYIPSRNQR